MPYNVLNYTEQGGAKTVIGGTLEIKAGATVTGLVDTTTIVDALDSTDTDKALSANQGKILKELIPVAMDNLPLLEEEEDDLGVVVGAYNDLIGALIDAGLMADAD